MQLVLQHPERAMDPRWRVRDVLDAAVPGGGSDSPLVGDLVDPAWLDRRPHEISGGQLQRVNLARALLARPRYVIADEISASLDAVTQARLWHLLLDHCRAEGIGVLAISHDRALLQQVAARVVDWQPEPVARAAVDTVPRRRVAAQVGADPAHHSPRLDPERAASVR